MGGRALFSCVLGLVALAGPAEAARVPKQKGAFVLWTGERLSMSGKRSLVVRSQDGQASLPLPHDVEELLEVDEDKATGTISLHLERSCLPGRLITLTRGELQARLLAESSAGASDKAEERLRKALNAAPGLPDLRVKLASVLVATGRTTEAEGVLKEGLRVTPFEVAWLARLSANTEPVIAKLVPADSAIVELGLVDGQQPPARVAWCASRGLSAFVDERWNLHVTSKGNAEVFTAELAYGRELDGDGRVLRRARKAVAARVTAAEAMLRQLGFRTLPPSQRIAADRQEDLSWVRFKDLQLSASAGNQVIRVRESGKVVFEERIDTVGTIGLDWGVVLPADHVLLLGWSRVAGSDECPNGEGIAQVPLPKQSGRK